MQGQSQAFEKALSMSKITLMCDILTRKKAGFFPYRSGKNPYLNYRIAESLLIIKLLFKL